jgi:hypothetical protein
MIISRLRRRVGLVAIDDEDLAARGMESGERMWSLRGPLGVVEYLREDYSPIQKGLV